MAYVKWVANVDRHNDWTTELILNDGKYVRMNEPVDLSADLRKQLEAEGRVFEDSSADEAKQYADANTGALQPPGGDIAGSAPVFANAGESRFNQVSEEDTGVDQAPSKSQRPQGGGSQND